MNLSLTELCRIESNVCFLVHFIRTGESNVYRTLIARINSAIKEGGFTTADKGVSVVID